MLHPDIVLSASIEGCIAMVVDVHHRAFPHWYEPRLRPVAEQAAVRRHVEQALHEFDTPRIGAGALVYQHGYAAVDCAGEVGVGAGTEDGAGARIGVKQREVLCRELEPADGVASLCNISAEEHEVG